MTTPDLAVLLEVASEQHSRRCALIKSAIERQQRQHIALSRFGTEEAPFSDTAPEATCKKALRGVKRIKDKIFNDYDMEQVAERFAKKPELQPNTLADCLHGRDYWSQLYWLRAAFEDHGDLPTYVQAHDDHCFAMLAKIAPRSKDESVTVLEHMEKRDAEDFIESPAILRNLIAGGWA